MRYMTQGKDIVPFYAMAKLKQTAQAKIIMSQIQIRKRGCQIVK